MLNNLEKRMLKPFVGYLEERDEYQQGEIHKILASACMHAFYVTTALMLISLIVDTINGTFTFGTIALFIVNQFVAYYIQIRLKKTGIAETEYDAEADYERTILRLKKKFIFAGAQWGFTMLILMEFLLPALAGEKLEIHLFSILIWLLAGAAFGICTYFLQKRNIKMFKEKG
ncbi:DUF3278 domain-containing protein [Paenibacillus sp. FSL R7-0331]|uniref:DUF3278 domain-containing protein n=1 Tax=Paenibacillus sp. FSL R7-0331 TaxID=1536773 RepID=UPI00069492F1|nr:DUF3278 domain-containing protein [Paenibacillus sp. FSL R7-0331]